MRLRTSTDTILIDDDVGLESGGGGGGGGGGEEKGGPRGRSCDSSVPTYCHRSYYRIYATVLVAEREKPCISVCP